MGFALKHARKQMPQPSRMNAMTNTRAIDLAQGIRRSAD
jgi:hypothetical protein